MIELLRIFLNVTSHIFNLNMDEWIPVNRTYRGGIKLLGIHRYLIPVWYQSLGVGLPKIIFLRVDSWSTGPPGFGASHMPRATMVEIPFLSHLRL